MNILVLEDSKESQVLIERALQQKYQIDFASTFAEGLEKSRKGRYSLYLIDVMLPDGSGFDFLEEISKQGFAEDSLAMFLTGKTDTSSLVRGFSLGADDYVMKPFDLLALRARVDAKMAKVQKLNESQKVIKKGSLEINLESTEVFLSESDSKEKIHLTPTQFRMLAKLVKNTGHVFSRRELIDEVWGKGYCIEERSVDKQMSAIRQKLGKLERFITTVSNSGYRFAPH